MDTGDGWVALDVTRLAAPVVFARPRPSLVDPTVRAGLIIDLAIRGALADAGDGLQIDTTPTGFAPADKLLAAVTSKPDKALAWWLYHAPVTVQDFAEVLVGEGTWIAHGHGPLRHHREADPHRRTAALRNLAASLRSSAHSPQAAATVVLLGVLAIPDLPRRLESRASVQDCGDARWIVSDLLDSLERWKEILAASGRASTSADALTYLA